MSPAKPGIPPEPADGSRRSSDHFYGDLPLQTLPVSEVMGEASLFAAVPGDWHVVLTDVKGSTRALDDGSHQLVNLVATGSIIAALNIARRADRRVPFFFGGDGATLLVPDSLAAPVVQALNQHALNTQRNFGLELRVGAVRVADLHAAGSTLSIAKAKLSEAYTIPVVLGDGLQEAERIIKGADHAPAPMQPGAPPDLEGMQCRWDAIRPPGEAQDVVCLLVTITKAAREAGRQGALCRAVLEALDASYGPPAARSPVSIERMRLKPSLARMVREVRARMGRLDIADLAVNWLRTLFGYVYLRFIPQGRNYLRGVARMSDTLMIDGRINTIVSGTSGQRAGLEAALDRLEDAGEIRYGLHVCPASVMSCYVRDRRNDHIHFVDGLGGGFTRAATVLKAKLARA